tara:strand:+ start:156 stop:527 length:372 start_codon:yes stop_codon:yes gene_type:complete
MNIFVIISVISVNLLFADLKHKKNGGNFLRINPKIENVDLKNELENLKEEFLIQRNSIVEEFDNKIHTLKQERKEKIIQLKDEFLIRKEKIMDSYSTDRVKKTKLKKHSTTKSKIKEVKTKPK